MQHSNFKITLCKLASYINSIIYIPLFFERYFSYLHWIINKYCSKFERKSSLFHNKYNMLSSPFLSTLDSKNTRDSKHVMILCRRDNASIPVILTAPHGGLRSTNQTMMSRDVSFPGVVTKSDLHTIELLILIDRYIREKTNDEKRPHVVIAKFHRQYVGI